MWWVAVASEWGGGDAGGGGVGEGGELWVVETETDDAISFG